MRDFAPLSILSNCVDTEELERKAKEKALGGGDRLSTRVSAAELRDSRRRHIRDFEAPKDVWHHPLTLGQDYGWTADEQVSLTLLWFGCRILFLQRHFIRCHYRKLATRSTQNENAQRLNLLKRWWRRENILFS